ARRDESRHALAHFPGNRNRAPRLERDDRELVTQPQAVLAPHAPADREDSRAAAERLDGQLQVERFAQAARLEEVHFGVDERRSQSAIEVVFLEGKGEPGFEPVLDDLVGHLEEAREIDDARRVAVGESYAAGKREGSRQSAVPRLRGREAGDDARAQAIEQPVEHPGVLHDLRTEERRAQHRRVRHLPAQPAAHAAVVDVRHRVELERVAGGAHRERGAARQADAGGIARAHVLVDTEAGARHALAALSLAATGGRSRRWRSSWHSPSATITLSPRSGVVYAERSALIMSATR